MRKFLFLIFTLALIALPALGNAREQVSRWIARAFPNAEIVPQGLLRRPQYTGGGYDTDAQAFFDAAGISDSTQKSAVNQLVLDLKSYSIWTKMHAVYPFVGGTSTTHRYNLKNPTDADAAFRLVFSGTWTHDANGVTGNGSSGYADTKYTPSSSAAGQNDRHLSVWAKSTLAGIVIGGRNAGYDRDILGMESGPAIAGSTSVGFYYNQSHTASTGLYCTSRTGASTEVVYRNGSSIFSTGITSAALPTVVLYLGASNDNGSAANYSNTNIAFASIGTGLNSTEASNLYTAVNAFQSTLGR